MNRELAEQLRNMSGEERSAYFIGYRSELLATDLEKVNGGTDSENGGEIENPNSDDLYKGNWFSSPGYVCQGKVVCS